MGVKHFVVAASLISTLISAKPRYSGEFATTILQDLYIIISVYSIKAMVPPIATAKTCLTYPLYAADFDPNSNSFLLVGGGGGEGRSGVGNKIV